MLAKRLGKQLIDSKLLSSENFNDAYREHKRSGKPFVGILLREQFIDENRLLSFLAKAYKLPIIDLASFQYDSTVTNMLDLHFISKNKIIPLTLKRDSITIATYDPTNIQVMDEVQFKTQRRVEKVLALPSVIEAIHEKYYAPDLDDLAGSIEEDAEEVDTELTEGDNDIKEDDAPIIGFVTKVLVQAIRQGASDIHVEPYDNDLRIRFRIDGHLISALSPPPKIKSALIARFKVMAKLRLDEKRLPQDGRIRIKLEGKKIVDFRVNTLPTIYGEKVVLRILDKSNASLDFASLGYEQEDLEKFQKAIEAPWGICLVTGATGSGKTTTLYTALNHLNRDDVNICTIEDPVEYNFHGMNQVNVKESIGLTFSGTLRALLRQDPDIILLGEIRDQETAKVAMKAAMTGHMVLSTLHTNDAPSSIMRLKDMGVDPFLINGTVKVIVAQRLIRKVCQSCKTVDDRFTTDDLVEMGFPPKIVHKFRPMRGKGCKVCSGLGYKGRISVSEVMSMSDGIRQAVIDNSSTMELRRIAVKEGMKTLKINCMRKIIKGLTSMDEFKFLASTYD